MPNAVVIGRLRRDLMLLASSEDENELQRVAEQAVAEGRAAETFVIPLIGYFSETEHNWAGMDQSTYGATVSQQSVPPLNPNIGDGVERPQESLAESDRPETSIAANILKNAEDSPRGPDTGRADAFHVEAGGTRAMGPLAGAGHAGGNTGPQADLTSTLTTDKIRRDGPTATVDTEAERVAREREQKASEAKAADDSKTTEANKTSTASTPAGKDASKK